MPNKEISETNESLKTAKHQTKLVTGMIVSKIGSLTIYLPPRNLLKNTKKVTKIFFNGQWRTEK